MHPNPIYRGEDRTRNLAFARETGFGTLAMNGAEGAADGACALHLG